ncbi:MAG TPA: RiPP maturation radical SAM C-methyltransferase, partial [Longimicrobium sp.]|nr:RiPP maturation radical SAM C-methyltransferase [Longimicrobium sp.]
MSTDIVYANHDFARSMGVPLYTEVTSMLHHPAGLGEWLFRQAAYPELADNSADYMLRYYPHRTPEMEAFRARILGMREGLGWFMDEVIARYRLGEAHLVGFTSMFAQNVASFAMARKLKAINPEIVTVLGGANCEAPMGQEIIRSVPWLDYVFSGPALKSFPELLRARLAGDDSAALRINGVFARSSHVLEAARTPHAPGAEVDAGEGVRAFGDELELDVPVPLDYDPFFASLDDKGIGDQVEPYVLFETSRGCWWGQRSHCTFCGLNGSAMGYRSMQSYGAIQQLQALFKHSGRSRRLESVDNIMPKSYLTEVLPFLDVPPDMGIFYEVRADLNEEDFRVLARARVRWIQPGIEALNTSTLKLMKKGTSAFQNIMFLMNCARFDITPAWNLLIGFPGEEMAVYEKYLADIPLLTHLPPPSGAFPVRFDRYSPYFVRAEEYGLKLMPLDYYPLVYPFPAEVLGTMAYYFADRNYTAKYFTNVARMQGKLRERIDRWKALWSHQDGTPRPELFLRASADGGWSVYDS